MLLTFMTGCTLLYGPRSDMVPGIAFPSERAKTMVTLARNAEKEGLAAQERLAAEMLAHLSNEKDPIIRGDIVREVGRFHTASAYQMLVVAMNDSNEAMRLQACRTLATWKEKAEVTQLLCQAMLEDASRDVRLEATRALELVADPAAVKSLALALEDQVVGGPDPALRDLAVVALRKSSPVDYGNDPALWMAHLRGESATPPSKAAIMWDDLRR